jgi:dolichyl-phosphate beta-glucosyltransferase
MPAYNESQGIQTTLSRLLAFFDRVGVDIEVIVVDDGSRDDTRSFVKRAAAADPRVIDAGLDENRGKGAAVREGLKLAHGRVVAFTDADLPYGPEKILEGKERIEAGADFVAGARDLATLDSRRDYPLPRRVASYVFGRFVAAVLGTKIEDSQCGLKLMRYDVAKAFADALTIDRFAFDVEMLLLARSWGLKVERLPVSMTHMAPSSVQLTRDALDMARDVARLAARRRTGRLPPRPRREDDG